MSPRRGASVGTGTFPAKASPPQRPLRPGAVMPSRMLPHLVIILSYGDPLRAIRCVRSLRADSDRLAQHILVVRNYSSTPDGDLPGFVAELPHADFLDLDTNRGFSGGMNAGLQWGLDHGFEVLTVLNDDTLASGQTLDHLAMAAQQDPQAAFCPRIDYLPARADPWFVGAARDRIDGLPRHLKTAEFQELPRSPNGCVEVELVTGCCVTASADAWLATGGFDERYFLYFEDSDWSKQADRVGLSLEILDATAILHSVSASSTGSAAYLTTFYYSRNLLLFGRTWPRTGVSPWRTWHRRSARPALRSITKGPVTGLGHTAMAGLGAAAWVLRRTGPAPRWVTATADLLHRAELHRAR